MFIRLTAFIAAASLFVSVSLFAAEDNYAFEDPQTRKTFLSLTEKLRCPMCQNQNIADSDAMIAHDMRRKVYQLLSQGKTEQEVIDYMKARYGDFVYYQPPVTPATVFLWFIPVGFVVIGGAIFIWVRRSKPTEQLAAKNASYQDELAKANALLEQDD